ncbi:hypothetical protein NM208_g13730 [Fusarium decemcellulare]|uniref:Uncharacterized protein n=1 Tax=Fusarium decemcellulare TaxID=57161 RepID=A0ACC1RIN4_9HYPO|nr:hypothetical protein NM208_g13730 [Fusarium decemcellulare]
MSLQYEDELLEAVAANDVSRVTSLLEDGADANAGLFRGEATALSIAVRNGREDIIDLLLNHVQSPRCLILVPSRRQHVRYYGESYRLPQYPCQDSLYGGLVGRTHMFPPAIDIPWSSSAIILGGLSSLEEKQPVYRPPSNGDTIRIGGSI